METKSSLPYTRTAAPGGDFAVDWEKDADLKILDPPLIDL